MRDHHRQDFRGILLRMNKEHQQEKRQFYQASELLSSLREEQIEAFLAKTTERVIACGEPVWRMGDRVDELIFIKEVANCPF